MTADLINVRDHGASGDGVSDDYAAFARALEAAKGRTLFVPDGNYRITHTLYIDTGTTVEASENARIFHCPSLPKHGGDFLITNRHHDTGDRDITISGGIWDGCFDGKNNTKNPDIFAEDAWSGTLIDFYNVSGLTLRNMVIQNTVTYHTRFGRIDGFRIENLVFRADRLAFNQDGLHFGGWCKNGVIRNIRAENGETNDDLIAFNADDSVTRLENRGLDCGDIENIDVDGVYADDCFTAFRMASVVHAVRNINIRHVRAGCRHYAVNMDGLRYCRTPMIQNEADCPNGCGNIENITIDDFTAFPTADNGEPLFVLEENCHGFIVSGFDRPISSDRYPNRPTIRARHLPGTVIELAQGEVRKRVCLSATDDAFITSEAFDALSVGSPTATKQEKE